MSELIKAWSAQYEDYLRDESRRIGRADSVSFPASEAEVVEVVKAVRASGMPITVQGARTGIVAGAVPPGGHILNLSRMNAIGEVREAEGKHVLTVQPGATLDDVRKSLEVTGFFFPPDPTESSCSIGGMVAANASGALTFAYGPTRNWILGIRMVLSDGDTLSLTRGQVKSQGRTFALTTEGGRVIAGNLPAYTMPSVKSAAGYYVADDMDMLDLFIGMEGTLGIVTQIECLLAPTPEAVNGLTVFLPDEDSALKFVRVLRGDYVEGLTPPPIRPVAIEFFNEDALNLLRMMKSGYSAFDSVPPLKPHFQTAVYVEFHADSQDTLDEVVIELMDSIVTLGGNDEDTWYGTDEREIEPQKVFRHAIPEAVNLLIDERRRQCPELAKLGTDMSVPDDRLEDVMAMYATGLRENNLQSAAWGHIGNNHVHVNILPHDMDEYERGRNLYLSWARKVVEWGGSVSAEHGIGKTKTPFLELMYGPQAIEEMRALKALFDPEGLLNPGNLF